MNDIKLNSIEEAVEDLRNGKLVIVVDDEDRENEGDFIAAAAKITPEMVNFMATEGRGLICLAITEERCEELELDMMVGRNTSLHDTPFTVSVDAVGDNVTTGISAHDRAVTIQKLANPATLPRELGRPGHIFPLRARSRGVLRRAGHTEAAVDLARLADLEPAGVLVEIMNQDGTMARLPELFEIAQKFGLKLVSIADLIAYKLNKESLIERGEEVQLPTARGNFSLIPFLQKSNGVKHIALIKGPWKYEETVLVPIWPYWYM